MTKERERRLLWVIGRGGRPKRCTGLSCAKNADGYGADGFWWFPELGFSTAQVFDTEEEARADALRQARRELTRAQELVDSLEKP